MRTCRRSDRGEITLIGAIIMVLVGAAAAATTIVVVNATKDTSPQAHLNITTFSAIRDASDLPVINLNYTAALAHVPDLVGRTLDVDVNCSAQEQTDRPRIFHGQAKFKLLAGTTSEGLLTITPGPANKDIEGTFRIRCELWRNGVKTAISKTFDLNVPKAGGPSQPTPTTPQPPAFDIAKYEGVYPVTFTLVSGSDCGDSTYLRNITIKALSNSRINVELGGRKDDPIGISAFDSDLSPTAQFSGTILLIPGFTSWIGLMTGKFELKIEPSVQLSGQFVLSKTPCSYTFTGSK